MKPRHSGHQTQWAAQFAVASELCKQGYEVALTMGNHPSVDLMVVSPGGVQFGIDVKGLHVRNFWLVKPKPDRRGLYYVLAFVPRGAGNRYFVLSQAGANAEIAANERACAELAAAKGKVAAPGFEGIPFAAAEKYADAWQALPR